MSKLFGGLSPRTVQLFQCLLAYLTESSSKRVKSETGKRTGRPLHQPRPWIVLVIGATAFCDGATMEWGTAALFCIGFGMAFEAGRSLFHSLSRSDHLSSGQWHRCRCNGRITQCVVIVKMPARSERAMRPMVKIAAASEVDEEDEDILVVQGGQPLMAVSDSIEGSTP